MTGVKKFGGKSVRFSAQICHNTGKRKNHLKKIYGKNGIAGFPGDD
jgi:hypothetical protein